MRRNARCDRSSKNRKGPEAPRAVAPEERLVVQNQALLAEADGDGDPE